MQKKQKSAREFRFYSEKNAAMVIVHSSQMREYADSLETRPSVVKYEAHLPLEHEKLMHLSPIDIRKEYFAGDWMTDFLLYFSDNTTGVREIIKKDDLTKRAVIEQLELSRRYWSQLDISDWKLVVTHEEDAYVF